MTFPYTSPGDGPASRPAQAGHVEVPAAVPVQHRELDPLQALLLDDVAAVDAPDGGLDNGYLSHRRARVRTVRRKRGAGLWIQRSAVAAVLLWGLWWWAGEDWYTAWHQNNLRGELAEQFTYGQAVDLPTVGFTDPNVPEASDLGTLIDPVTGVADDPRIDTGTDDAAAPEQTSTVAALPSEDTSAPADPDGSHARRIGRIQIPAIDVDWAVGDGVEIPDLRAGPGWMPETAALGSPGNAVVSGHRTTYGAPFNRVHKLEVGDEIIVSVPGKADAVYEVRDLFVIAPTEVGVINPTAGSRLTLTTCHPIGSARERLIVQAEQVSGPGASAAVDASQWRNYDGEVIERLTG